MGSVETTRSQSCDHQFNLAFLHAGPHAPALQHLAALQPGGSSQAEQSTGAGRPPMPHLQRSKAHRMREGQQSRWTKEEWTQWRAQQAAERRPAPARSVEELGGPWPGRTGAWAADDEADSTTAGSSEGYYRQEAAPQAAGWYPAADEEDDTEAGPSWEEDPDM